MSRYIYLLAFSVLLWSCKVQKTAVDENLPAWSKERPKSAFYYIGIAKVDKKLYPVDYQETAKRIALNDLASEISVKIESNSLLSSYEDNASFNSDYQQFIKTETNKDLTGYELEASYETKKTYQVYYKLSKSKWDQIQADRKAEASKKSYHWYQKAKEEEQKDNFTTASQYYIDALLELKKYWSESVSYRKDTVNFQLDREIKSDLIALLSDVNIKARQKQLMLNTKNGFNAPVNIYLENSEGQLIKNIPLKASYRKSSMTYQTSFLSASEPYAFNVEGVDYKRSNLKLKVEVDKSKLFKIKSADKRMLSFVYDAFDPKPLNIPIQLEMPKVFISVKSAGKYQSAYMHYLKDAIREVLAAQNIYLSNGLKDSDYQVVITAHESKGSDSQRFKTMYLSYTLEVIQTSNGQMVHSQSSPQVKGADITFEKAKEKAFVKASEEFEYQHAKTLIKGILN